MRHRPGWDWLVATMAIVALAAAFVVLLMNFAEGAERRLQRGELEIMVRIVVAESRGETLAGQRAIANVMLNRLDAGVYGKTLTRVLLKPYQFAKPAPLDDISPSYLRAMLATVQAILRTVPDDSAGATHFHVCAMRPRPAWASRLRRTATIGAHCFYRER